MTVGTTGALPEPLGLLPGDLLLDRSWLAEQIRATGAYYRCESGRLNATLWWYSASAVLLGRPVHELVLLGRGVSLEPGTLRMVPRPAGLERVIPGPAVKPGAPAFGAHLDAALAPVIDALCAVGPVSPQSLWAITVDSLATRILAETAGPHGPSAGQVATEVAQGSRLLRPTPRCVQVSGRDYVHRVSCCLLYRVPFGKCLSCPRQTPEERLERLEAHAQGEAMR